MIQVFILTFCRDRHTIYGNELVFKTLRVGFPNAKVTVIDNASLPVARARIKELAKRNECEFIQIKGKEIEHHAFIYDTIRLIAKDQSGGGPLVFLDPDICLWKTCEEWIFEGVMAGKPFGRYYDYVTQTITMPRIHTSFLWIPDPKRLMEEIWRVQARHFDFHPFLPASFFMDGAWYRFDTGANLFAVLGQKISIFRADHLNHFDHLYAGTHLDWIYPFFDEKCKELFARTHTLAKKGDINALRGIWKQQEEVFRLSFGTAAP